MNKATYRIAAVFCLLALVGFVVAEDKAKSRDTAKGPSAGCASGGCATAGYSDAKACPASGCSVAAAGYSDAKACPASGCAVAAAGCSDAKACPASGCAVAAAGCGDAKACATTVALQGDKLCPIDLALEKLPKISFAVGEEKTCCPKAAGELAKKSGTPIHFVVAEKTYAKESDAKLALVEATEKYVSDFAKPKKCAVSGTITVAGDKCGCDKSAAHKAKVVQAAMDNVKFTYLVGEKKCHCPVEAKQVAKESGQDTLFVVGDEKTKCSVTARLNLARAKYKAAIQALAVSQAEAIAERPKAKAGA